MTRHKCRICGRGFYATGYTDNLCRLCAPPPMKPVLYFPDCQANGHERTKSPGRRRCMNCMTELALKEASP